LHTCVKSVNGGPCGEPELDCRVMWLPFLTAGFGAFFGTIGGLLSALILARRTERQNNTNQMMTFFFSDDFLHHRVSVSALAGQVRERTVTVDEIAGGFWYPGADTVFTMKNSRVKSPRQRHDKLRKPRGGNQIGLMP
jgi:hypothetical protein